MAKIYGQLMKNFELQETASLPNCLSNEVANNTAIINIHPGSIGVENSSNPYLCQG